MSQRAMMVSAIIRSTYEVGVVTGEVFLKQRTRHQFASLSEHIEHHQEHLIERQFGCDHFHYHPKNHQYRQNHQKLLMLIVILLNIS